MNEILQKRIEEAARDYSVSWIKNPDGSESRELFPVAAKRSFIAGATFALGDQWISVEEALPEENGWYLTLNIKSKSPNFADTCQWNANGKCWYTALCGDVFLHERTHWMPIPPLKGGEQ